MIMKRHGLADIGFKVRRVARVNAAAHARPRRRRKAIGRRGRSPGQRRIAVERVLDLCAETGGETGGVGLERFGRPVAGFGLCFRLGESRLRLEPIERRAFAVLRPLQQRIARQFILDEGVQLDIRHLQQLDRLQQLRRQNHCLALPDRQFGRKRHSCFGTPALSIGRRFTPRLASCFSDPLLA